MLALVLAGTLGGCGDDSSQPAKPTVAEDVQRGAESPFRYGPTLRDAIPKGVTVEPLLEVASPDEARLHIVAAVHRPGETPALRIEQWPFTQHNEKGTLAPEGDPVTVIPIRAGEAEPAALPKLRVRLAAATSQVTRPVGLPADDATALLATMAEHAKLVRNADAAPDARVAALASLFRGFDDHVVFETRDLPAAIDSLAAGAWTKGTAKPISARRIAVTVDGQQIEVAKKSGGWAITDVR